MASRVPYRVALTAALAAGTLTRLWNLPSQVVGYDELHAVRAALEHPLGEILRTYQRNDNCLPLTALDRLWIDSGRPLTELVMRLPVLLCGLVLLWWLPRVVARRLGDATALALAWLLALSPLLVLYSRIARSYAPIVLFGSLSVVAFLRWWLCGNRLAAALHVLFAALTVYFHLLAAPFVLSPWLFAAGDLCVRPRTSARPKPLQIVVVLLATAVALAAFLLPALDSLIALLAVKGGEGAVTSDTLAGLLSLWSGTGQPLLALLFWVAALAGLGRLWTQQRRLAAFTLVLLVTQATALLLLAPFLVGIPLILSRYMLVALPVVLLWVAVALGAAWTAAVRPALTNAWRAAAVVFVAALVLCGPLADPFVVSSSFPHANDYMDYSRPYPTLPRQAVPAFYRGALEPGPIAEAPWPTSAKYGRSLLVYEREHRRRVLVVPYDETLDDPRLDFRNLVTTPEEILASPARYLVLHADLAAEERQFSDATEVRGLYQARADIEAAAQRRWAAQMHKRLSAEWGPPDDDDGRVAAWDLDRVRARSTG